VGNMLRGIIRTSAFLRKEIYEVLRQPRLIATLVLGPFIILFLFGIGYRNQALPLRTIFVVEQDSPLQARIEEFAGTLGPQLIYEGTTPDEDYALELLRRRMIDLVAVAPPQAYETIRNQEQAVFVLYHNEISPFQIDYVNYFGQVYIDEVNRRVLQNVADQGQDRTGTTRDELASARASATAMREALEGGNVAEAQRHQAEMNRSLENVETSTNTTLDLLEGVQQNIGADEQETTGISEFRGTLTEVRTAGTDLELTTGQEDQDEEIQRAAEIETNLTVLDSQLGEYQRIDSHILVSPFRSEARSIAAVQPELADYFAPSVVVLLLQHLAVTFAALSLVREQLIGAVELFRVSPISTGETLLGKYLSYMIFGGVLALILTALIIYLLQVPMLGLWANYAVVIAALLFASLGFGFVISLISTSDSQAVQYAMIILLTSVFFSGFFLALETLWEPVRVISWMVPATYAIQLLQDIMLRGTTGNPIQLYGLFGIGIILYLVSWLLLKRMMRST
jgi:ABC-2 type transport system permease protein